MTPSAIIIGAGPGIGTAVARRLAREGFAVGLVARSAATLAEARDALGGAVHAVTADVTDEAALRAALDELVDRLGTPEVLVYNAALIQADVPGELSAQQHLDAYAVNVVGAITAASQLAPRMAGGTILLTGGMPEPIPDVTSLSLGKAGLRALTELLQKHYADVHVATITVGGAVAPGTDYDPDDIAEHYWRLHAQPAGAWEHEVLH